MSGCAELNVAELDGLLTALREAGYALVGPTVRQDAIVYADITGVADLPAGLTDEQRPGHYRLQQRTDGALFGFAVGPHSWKSLFHVPVERLFVARRHKDGAFVTEPQPVRNRRVALVGARSCDLHAIAVQDRVLLGGPHADPRYAVRRQDVFVVAVMCGQAGGNCFCVSMDTGPRPRHGFDIALAELIDERGHRFVAEAGTDAGAQLLARIGARPADPDDVREREAVVERTAKSMGRTVDTKDIKELLYRNLEHPRWDDVAARCLGCTNCTLVCPTCFCTSVSDSTDLAGSEAVHEKRWDSCFNLDFSYLHGGSVRSSLRSRYRQWLTHKMATWIDQFGTSGCVGCGRCITWCPVGIDITEELAAIRATDMAGNVGSGGGAKGGAK